MSKPLKMIDTRVSDHEVFMMDRASFSPLQITNESGRPLALEMLTDGVVTYLHIREDVSAALPPALERDMGVVRDIPAELEPVFCTKGDPPAFAVGQRVVLCVVSPAWNGREAVVCQLHDKTAQVRVEGLGEYVVDLHQLKPAEPPAFHAGQSGVSAVVRMARGDLTGVARLPIPFLDGQGNQIGEITKVRFDGEYTVGTVHFGAPEPPADEPTAVTFREWL